MYTRNLLNKIFKIKNVILYIIGVFAIMGTAYVIVHDIVYDIFSKESLLYSSIIMVAGVVLIFLGMLSNRWIEDANMYSAYFEGDLDGVIPMADMARLMGAPAWLAIFRLQVLRLIYMKGFSVKNKGRERQIVLGSRKIVCQCNECGGEMERSVHFTGKCSYCGGLDIYTKVLCGEQFYSVKNEIAEGLGNPLYYQMPKLNRKMILAAVIWGIGAMFALISFAGFCDNWSMYRADRSNVEVLDTAIVFAAIFIGFLIPMINGIKRMVYVRVARSSSEYFAKRKTPYVKLSSVPFIKSGINKRFREKMLKNTVRKRYLMNCNFEIHKNELKLVLSKRIVKNRCPYCGGATSVPVNEHYKCTYCDKKIMNLIKSK